MFDRGLKNNEKGGISCCSGLPAEQLFFQTEYIPAVFLPH